tara:strand:+ start:889 stop:2010 length:1122 start_codon:yes stop_codon:yes gene_type:complete
MKISNNQIIKKKKVTRAVKLLAVIVTIFIMLSSSELMLRFMWKNWYTTESSDYFLKLRIQPANRDRPIGRSQIDPQSPVVVFKTDKRGYILPTHRYQNPDRKIVFMGGSTTECIAVKEELRFPVLVSDLLAERGIKANTLNGARSGNTIKDSVNILLNHVIYDDPDIVVVMHATNDIGKLNAFGSYEYVSPAQPLNSSKFMGWIKKKLSAYSYTVGFLRSRMAILKSSEPAPGEVEAWSDRFTSDPNIIEKIPIEEYRKHLKAFVHICFDFEIVPILMTQPLSAEKNELTPAWADMSSQQRFNEVIRQVSKSENAILIDLDKFLREKVNDWNKPMNIFYDGMHITDKGSIVYADYITNKLEPLLRKLSASKSL